METEIGRSIGGLVVNPIILVRGMVRRKASSTYDSIIVLSNMVLSKVGNDVFLDFFIFTFTKV